MSYTSIEDSEFSAILEQSSRIVEKQVDEEGTGSCSEAEVDLEFGISKSARKFKSGTAYSDFVTKEEDIGRVPIVSETIVVTSSGGARSAIEKWGEITQIFGNLKNVDCPCNEICKNLRGERIKDARLSYLGYATTPGTFYYYNTDKSDNYNERLREVAATMTSPTEDATTLAGPLVNHFSLGTWWYDHNTQKENYGLYGWNNVDNSCEKQNGENNCWQANPGSYLRWGSAQLYSDVTNVNKQFTMDCEYGLQSSTVRTDLNIPNLQPGEFIEYAIPEDKLFAEKFVPTKTCWYLGNDNPNYELDSGSGISLIIDKAYWQNIINLKGKGSLNVYKIQNNLQKMRTLIIR